MQSSKRLVSLNLNSINKLFFARSVSVNTATVNADDTVVKPWREIPGPSSLPIIGQMLHFLPGGMFHDFVTMQEKMYKNFGPIVRMEPFLGRPPMLFLYDAESCAHILRAENWSPVRPGFNSIEYYRKKHNKTEEQSKLPTGLITDHGENWRSFRTTVNPIMLQTKTIKLYRSQLDEVARDMIERMKSKIDQNNKLTENFNTEMNLWALESIGLVALGGRLNCFNRDLTEDSPEKRLIQCVHDIFRVTNELDFKPSMWKYYATKTFKKAMALFKEQEELATHFIKRARKDLEAKKEVNNEEKGILEKLLEIDERTAIIMATDMLFAGVDTAATTMTATLYLLASNQDKQNKLREALALGDQKYLKACTKEALRIMPVVGGNMRKTTKEYNILGYNIPKDVMVIFVHQYLSKMEEQFPRPKEYIPERWIEEGPLSHKNAHPFAYSPFGFGVRMCIGRRIAELEIETFLSHLIKNFKVEWSGPPPEVVPTSLNYIKGPFNFTFKDV